MTNVYKQGNSIKTRAVFRDVDGELIDPETVVCKVKAPDDIEAAYQFGVDAGVIRESEGVYEFWVETDQAGMYTYRWKGSGAESVADEETFVIEESAFINP